jgi:hypothetical protein
VRVVRFRLAVVLVVLSGCGDDPPPRRHTHDPPPASAHATEVATPVDRGAATLVRVSGAVRVGTVPAADGTVLDHGDAIALDDGAEAVIDTLDGDRITLFGPVVARVGDPGAAVIEIANGSAHVRLPPGPAGPRAPLRVASPESTVELIGPGEVLVVADRSGATWTVVMSGVSHVAHGDADARHRARMAEVTTGHAIVVADQIAEPTEGPVRLDEARAAAHALFGAATPIDPTRLADRARHAASDLDSALGWVEAEARHGTELTDEHRAAVAASNADEAMRLQRALVGHAQELHALRDTARLRWERLVALVLEGAVRSGEPDPIAPRRDRAVALLGLE